MTRRRRTTEVVAVLAVLIGVLGLVLNMLAPANFDSRPAEVLYLCVPMTFATVGGLLVRRRPDHAAGYLLVLAALGVALDSPAKAVINLGRAPHGSLLTRLAATVDNCTWALSFLALAVLLQVLPDGRPAGPRWRWLARTTIVVGLVLVVCTAVADHSYAYDTGSFRLRTLVPSNALTRNAGTVAEPLLSVLAALALAGVVGLFVRYRRSRRAGDAVTTAQLRWLLWGGAITILTAVLSQRLEDGLLPHHNLYVIASVIGEVPAYALLTTLVIAVTRYRLFDIDRVISRTVSYGLITAVLVAVYLGLVAGLSTLLPESFGSFGVAVSTLAVAALFVPVRRTVQARVDRRFDRARQDRARLVTSYAEQLRHDVTHGADGADLVAVVRQALAPAHVSVWTVAP